MNFELVARGQHANWEFVFFGSAIVRTCASLVMLTASAMARPFFRRIVIIEIVRGCQT